MAYYFVIEVTPTSEDWIPTYLEKSGPILAKYGGKYLTRTVSHEQVEGHEDFAALRIILEWPSKEAAQSFMEDPDYAPLLQARTEGSISKHFLIEAKDDMA